MRFRLRTTDRLRKWESDKHVVGFGLLIVDHEGQGLQCSVCLSLKKDS